MLIALSGLKGSGKDTAAKVLVDEYGFTKIAFADALRQALLILNPSIPTSQGSCKLSKLIKNEGWDQIKRTMPEVRRLMQVFGTEVGRTLLGENVWVDILAKRYPDIGSDDVRYVITDCRFDNEVDFVRSRFGLLVWVDRPGVTSDGHSSESDHIKDLADVVLHNDETIDELHEDIRFMLFMRGFDRIV